MQGNPKISVRWKKKNKEKLLKIKEARWKNWIYKKHRTQSAGSKHPGCARIQHTNRTLLMERNV